MGQQVTIELIFNRIIYLVRLANSSATLIYVFILLSNFDSVMLLNKISLNNREMKQSLSEAVLIDFFINVNNSRASVTKPNYLLFEYW